MWHLQLPKLRFENSEIENSNTSNFEKKIETVVLLSTRYGTIFDYLYVNQDHPPETWFVIEFFNIPLFYLFITCIIQYWSYCFMPQSFSSTLTPASLFKINEPLRLSKSSTLDILQKFPHILRKRKWDFLHNLFEYFNIMNTS